MEGVPATSDLARWDGQIWSSVGAGLSSPAWGENYTAVVDMIEHDDGTGPASFVAGWFTHAGACARQWHREVGW